jgi:integrase/recombinase XerD
MNWPHVLQDYLALRRALGYKLHSDGTALESFVAFMEQQHQDAISTELALAWATLPTTAQPARWARRLSMVRGFARYCRALDSRSEVPPCDLLPMQYQRQTPYFFTDDDIRQLLQATLQLDRKDCFFNQTLHCLFGLLSVSGLRVGEALNLVVDDVDLDTGVLTIRGAKFGKSRLIPLHQTTVGVLVSYKKARQEALTGQPLLYWFVNRQRRHLSYDCARYHFNHLMTSISPNSSTKNRRPHLHDLRHRFALSTLITWYHDGLDVERCLPILSAYLGHVETRDTYWYLSACPALMHAATERLEQHWRSIS